MNKVILIGNLTKEVEIKQFTSGNIVGNMSLGVNRHFVKADGTKDSEVCYIDLVVYGKTAEICNQYLKKGSKVCVEGRLVFQQWIDQHSNKKSKHVIAVEKVEFLNSKNDSDISNYPQQNANNNHTTQQADYTNIDLNEEEIPF